jgi:hypothetical protein
LDSHGGFLRADQGRAKMPDGPNWLCYFAGSSKSHRENSISFVFLESPHEVDIKNVVKCWKDFLSYFTTLETYRGLLCKNNLKLFNLKVAANYGNTGCGIFKPGVQY